MAFGFFTEGQIWDPELFISDQANTSDPSKWVLINTYNNKNNWKGRESDLERGVFLQIWSIVGGHVTRLISHPQQFYKKSTFNL